MKTAQYKGWTIRRDDDAPVTGRWRADRHGVGMCNNTVERIIRMVDVRDAEARSVAVPPMPAWHLMDTHLLAAWYEDAVGYDPFADDPATTVDDVRDRCEYHYQAARCTVDRAGHAKGHPDFDPCCGVLEYGQVKFD